MTRIQVDSGLQQTLTNSDQPVALCDLSGNVLGHFLSEKQYTDFLYASYELPLSEEELARRRAETGGCSLQEIWRKLGRT